MPEDGGLAGLYRRYQRPFWFLATGAVIAALGLGCNLLLTKVVALPAPASYAISLALQLALGWSANRFIVFRADGRSGQSGLAGSVAGYLGANAVIRLLDWLSYSAMVEWLGVQFLVAHAVNLVVFLGVKYLVYRVIFLKPAQP